MRSAHLSVVTLLVAGALMACGGQSKQDEAMSTVCDARADIGKQVDMLKGMTPQTFTVDSAQQSLKAIGSDLSQIKDAQGDLADDRRQQVQDASQAFASQLEDIARGLGSSLSASSAKEQATAALQQLATSYRQTFAKVDCG
jgi:ribosome-binding protein aMBF1 (putative translation factor)